MTYDEAVTTLRASPSMRAARASQPQRTFTLFELAEASDEDRAADDWYAYEPEKGVSLVDDD